MSELPGVGLPARRPGAPGHAAAYPAVHDMPPQRPAPLLNESERAQMEEELVSARDRQQAVPAPRPRSRRPRCPPTKEPARRRQASGPAAPPAATHVRRHSAVLNPARFEQV